MICDMHAFQIPYVYDYITKLCIRQAEIIHFMKMKMYVILDKVKPYTENIKGLNLVSRLLR
jgi:hypothetical protein